LTSAVVRCSPDEDATNGFFVACFSRCLAHQDPSSLNLKRKADVDIDVSEPKAKKKQQKKKKKKPGVSILADQPNAACK
jgi:putative methyltransferase